MGKNKPRPEMPPPNTTGPKMPPPNAAGMLRYLTQKMMPSGLEATTMAPPYSVAPVPKMNEPLPNAEIPPMPPDYDHDRIQQLQMPSRMTMEHPLIKKSIPTYDTIPPAAQQMLSETVMKDYKGDADPMQVLLDAKSYLYAKKNGLLPETYPDTLEELMMQSLTTAETAKK